MAADDLLPLGPAIHEIIYTTRGAVIDSDGVAAAFHVEDEVFAHDGQADQGDVSRGSRHRWISRGDGLMSVSGIVCRSRLSGRRGRETASDGLTCPLQCPRPPSTSRRLSMITKDLADQVRSEVRRL